MHRNRQLRASTRKYMCRFEEILDTMAEGMMCAGLCDSISSNFIAQMIPHHRGAIAMSQNVLKYTALLPLREIAQNIITEQSRSMENMREILCTCSENTNSRDDLCLYQKNFRSITCTMLQKMQNTCTDNQISANFMREMIPHHIGAINMSKNSLEFAICSQLVPILQEIISSQEEEIEKMRCLLKELYE